MQLCMSLLNWEYKQKCVLQLNPRDNETLRMYMTQYARKCMQVLLHIYARVYGCVFKCVYLFTCVYVCVRACVCVCVNMHK